MTFFAKHKTIPRFSYIKILSHEIAVASAELAVATCETAVVAPCTQLIRVCISCSRVCISCISEQLHFTYRFYTSKKKGFTFTRKSLIFSVVSVNPVLLIPLSY